MRANEVTSSSTPSPRQASAVSIGGVVGGAVLAALATAPAYAVDWTMFGQNAANTAYSPQNSISIANLSTLTPRWVFTTGGDVSARASVANGVAYFPDWGGNLWAVATGNGKKLWSHQLSDYFTGAVSGSIHSRTTPAVDNGTLYVGTQEGAYLLSINATTGALNWKAQLSVAPGTTTVDDPYAIVTVSPVVYNGVVYTGVASIAEGATYYGVNMSTVTARGSAVAVNTATGTIKWKTYTVPQGYTGGGVWGSNPVLDTSRNLVYVSTGDNYTHPASTAESVAAYPTYGACIAAGQAETSCLSPNDHVDSVLALDMSSGALVWATREVNWNQQTSENVANGSDDWNVDCLFGLPQCPSNAGPDYDFGSAPNEITYQTASGPKTIIGAGQKSGIYYALDPDTGAELWRTQVGPGSSLGGIEWGSASDGTRIYVAIANDYNYPNPAGGNAGSWAALDPATGNVLWQTADPGGAIDLGPLAVSNGVVYAPSMAGTTTAQSMLALNAATGSIVWSYPAGSSVIAGATIVGNKVFWGSGYKHLGVPGQTGNNKFYGFSTN